VERKLAAILAADVVGYSRLIAKDEARTLDALRALRRESFEPLVAEHRGEVVKRMGDGWLVSFASVVDAAQCAIRVQERLAGHDRIKLRVGVHLGDIVHEDEDIYGDGVNIAARLQEIAEPGGVLISGTAYESVIGRLDGLFEDAGAQHLKNVVRPIRAWRWQKRQTDAAMLPIVGAEQPPPPKDKPSIVILPFVNMSNDPEQEFLADGIAEDITTALSKFGSLFVISRTSALPISAANWAFGTWWREVSGAPEIGFESRRSWLRLLVETTFGRSGLMVTWTMSSSFKTGLLPIL
jgi:adenylate cyclase